MSVSIQHSLPENFPVVSTLTHGPVWIGNYGMANGKYRDLLKMTQANKISLLSGAPREQNGAKNAGRAIMYNSLLRYTFELK